MYTSVSLGVQVFGVGHQGMRTAVVPKGTPVVPKGTPVVPKILEGQNFGSIMNFAENLVSQNSEGMINAHQVYNLTLDHIKKDFSNIISGVNILRLSNNPIELKKNDLKKIILEE